MVWDPIWEEVFSSQEWGKYPEVELVKFIARNFYSSDNRKKVKILEVGFGGNAPNIWFLAREGFSVFGVDGSATALEKSLSRLKNEGLEASLRVGDISNELKEYPSDYFDAVIDAECLYANSLADTKKIIAQLSRVTKPGGKIFSITFTDEMYVGEQKREVGYLQYDSVKNGPFEKRGFVRLVKKPQIEELYNPFKIISIDRITKTFFNSQSGSDEWIIIGEKI